MSERPGLDAVFALVIRVAGAALVFGLQVLLARLLPEEGYGGFVTLWTWMLALGSFAALGLAESSVRFLPRYQVRGRHAALRGFWRFGLRTVVAVGALLLIGAFLLTVWGGVEGTRLTVLLVLLGLPALALEYYLEGVARSFGWFRLAAVPVYIMRPVLIGSACLALTAMGVELTLPLIGAVLVGAMLVVVAIMALLLARRLRAFKETGKAATARQKRLWLAASLPLLLLSGLEDLASYADVLVLTLFAEPDVVAVYFAAARALALAGFVAYAMTLVSGRRFAVDLAVANRVQLQSSLVQTTRQTFWATVVAVGLTLLAGQWLLAAFGEAYVDGYGIMMVLGAGMVVRAMSGQAAEALVVLGRQREALLVALVVVLVTAALAAALVPSWGAMGAAVASVTAMTCRTLALAGVLWRTDGLRVVNLGLPRRAGVI